MYCYKLTIAYEGTHYSGWQRQPNAGSVQEHIQNALERVLHTDKVKLTGSGRTDAGVHALGQIANFKWHEELDLNKLIFAVNGIIPRDIRIKTIEIVQPDFHARYSAKGKVYHYHLHLDQVMDPFKRFYSWHVHRPIDLELLKKACQYFVGTHDFTSFANEAHSGSAARNPVRTIYRIDIVEESGGLRFEFEGDGFLYRMVRNIVGTVVAVASGKRPLGDIPELFKLKDRSKASVGAPSRGLFLVRVNY